MRPKPRWTFPKGPLDWGPSEGIEPAEYSSEGKWLSLRCPGCCKDNLFLTTDDEDFPISGATGPYDVDRNGVVTPEWLCWHCMFYRQIELHNWRGGAA